MSLRKTLLIAGGVWIAAITALHHYYNPDIRVLPTWLAPSGPQKSGDAKPRVRVGFLPVTCHLTCPVTDFINKEIAGDGLFEPARFNGFPELKEAFLANDTKTTFILAPLAIALREQGIPLKIVYLGHRDGTAMMVHKDSSIRRIEDLKGRRVAVPNRFSNQYLLLFKALRDRGLSIDDIILIELPPPDMPAALYAGAVDAITSGEPFMGQTELDGYGRILYLTKDVWPNFISCVLAVNEELIENDRPTVQAMVEGIARSGKWIDQTMDHRMQASQFVARNYYNQDPRLLEFVLSKPPDRVKYTNLAVMQKEFEEIEELGRAAGILKGTARFQDYADPSFVPDDSAVKPYEFEAKKHE